MKSADKSWSVCCGSWKEYLHFFFYSHSEFPRTAETEIILSTWADIFTTSVRNQEDEGKAEEHEHPQGKIKREKWSSLLKWKLFGREHNCIERKYSSFAQICIDINYSGVCFLEKQIKCKNHNLKWLEEQRDFARAPIPSASNEVEINGSTKAVKALHGQNSRFRGENIWIHVTYYYTLMSDGFEIRVSDWYQFP